MLCCVPLSEVIIPKVEALLLKYEKSSVEISERFVNFLDNSQNSKGNFFCLCNSETSAQKSLPEKNGAYTDVAGLVFVSQAGLILHVFEESVMREQGTELQKALIPVLKTRQVYCISGEEQGSKIIESVVSVSHPGLKQTDCREYGLMEYREEASDDTGLVPEYKIIHCTGQDYGKLIDLQKEYDIVEVLPSCMDFNFQLCRGNLLRVLELGRVYAIPTWREVSSGTGKTLRVYDESKTYAAKAALSALSRNCIQIGGVFTQRWYRKKGCAASLTRWLARQALKTNKQAVLFVRKENTPAIHAYENAGFYFIKNYRISYYFKSDYISEKADKE